MKVLIKTNLGTRDFPPPSGETPYCEGETREVENKVGAAIVSRGLGIDVTPTIKAVTQQPPEIVAPEKPTAEIKAVKKSQPEPAKAEHKPLK